MKQKFSKSWKASKQPRKQRKFLANAPLHIKKKLLSVNLSKELRKKYGQRNARVRKGDSVLIMRGKFRGKKGKVLDIKTKTAGVYVEGINVKKMDGSKSNVRLKPSNLQIVELKMEDKKRLAKKEIKTTKKESKKVKSGEKKK